MLQKNAPGLIQLADGVELLAGPDDMPLLYVADRKSYLRLSEAGAEIVRLLLERYTMTLGELIHYLVGNQQADQSAAQHSVAQFLSQLDAAGALVSDRNDSLATPSFFKRTIKRTVKNHRVMLALWHPDRPLAANLLQLIKKRIGHIIGRIVAFIALTAIIVVTYVAITPQAANNSSTVNWSLIIALSLLHTAGHEMAHVLVSSYYGVKVREIGIALLYYFIPVAYTDRTDAYRLRSFRERAFIALAGPAFDLFAASLSAIVAAISTGSLCSNFRMLLWVQLAGLISNLNPLLPGDVYHVFEAWFGAVNFRKRAFTVLRRRLILRALPPHLKSLSIRQQIFHFGYAVLAAVYVGLLAWVFLGSAVLKMVSIGVK
ncbi:MAG TPA: PqqD family peptide modification chaperone [Blastocatellia bacterium]|nr:PqqD family peptide modification chaperone [Blastocatellia bacterium]